jgi:hypothetical protein
MDAQGMVDYVRRTAVDKIRPKMGPDDDWMPVVFWWNGGLGMVGLEFGNDLEKALAYTVVARNLIERHHAFVAATVNTAWLGSIVRDGELPQMRPSQDPERVEVLLIQAADWAGRTASWMGRITRGQTCPLVEEWYPSTANPIELVGMIPDTLKEALANNASYAGANPN